MSIDIESSNNMELEELDRQRDEMPLEGLEDFMQATTNFAQDVVNFTSLEVTLEAEKSRLAQMEVELLEAKKQRESGQQMIMMKKQSRALMSVVDRMNIVNEKESFHKQEWDLEWQERLSSFHKQHREMEEALKIRHVNELKSLQEELQRHIRKLAVEVQKTKGKRVPSPRTLSVVQQENMNRIIALFQKQSQERLMLASKIAKQEELLIRSKNQGLQKVLGEAQATAGQFYRKFNLPVPEFKRLQITFPSAQEEKTANSLESCESSTDKVHRSIRDHIQPQSRNSTVYAGAISRGTTAIRISLSSPRLGEEAGTFLTEIEYTQPQQPEIDVSAEVTTALDESGLVKFTDSTTHLHVRHGGFLHSAAPTGSLAATQAHTSHYGVSMNSNNNMASVRSSDPLSGSHQKADSSKIGRSMQGSVQYGNQTSDAMPYRPPQQTRVEPSIIAYGDNDKLQLQASAFNIAKDDVKQPWNSWKNAFVSQVTAPIYGPPSKTNAGVLTNGGGFKKPSLSPYLIPQPGKGNTKLGSASARMIPRDTVRAIKASQVEFERSRSVSARLEPPHEQHIRAVSTLPLIQGAHRDVDGCIPGVNVHESRTIFPHLEDTSGRRKANETIARTDDSDAAMKNGSFAKLESWIEEKIKAILSGTLDKRELQFSQKVQRPVEQATDNFSASKTVQDFEPTKASTVESQGTQNTEQIDAELKNNGEIGNLLNRLRATMNADAVAREPGPLARELLRNGMAKSNKDSRNEGLNYINPKLRAADTTSREERFRGTEISQEPLERFEIATKYNDTDVADKDREQDRKQKEQDRRQRLEQLDVDPLSHPARQSKGPKKVGWNLRDDEAGLEINEVDDNNAQESIATDESPSRPDTSASALSETESKADSLPDSRGDASRDLDDLEKDYFSLVRHNKVKEFEEVLLRANVPIDTRDRHGNTALMVAAQNGHKRLVKLCLHHGADPNTSNHQGNTALHFANSYGYTTVASYLISKGADDTLMNHRGQTCYDKI